MKENDSYVKENDSYVKENDSYVKENDPYVKETNFNVKSIPSYVKETGFYVKSINICVKEHAFNVKSSHSCVKEHAFNVKSSNSDMTENHFDIEENHPSGKFLQRETHQIKPYPARMPREMRIAFASTIKINYEASKTRSGFFALDFFLVCRSFSEGRFGTFFCSNGKRKYIHKTWGAEMNYIKSKMSE